MNKHISELSSLHRLSTLTKEKLVRSGRVHAKTELICGCCGGTTGKTPASTVDTLTSQHQHFAVHKQVNALEMLLCVMGIKMLCCLVLILYIPDMPYLLNSWAECALYICDSNKVDFGAPKRIWSHSNTTTRWTYS